MRNVDTENLIAGIIDFIIRWFVILPLQVIGIPLALITLVAHLLICTKL